MAIKGIEYLGVKPNPFSPENAPKTRRNFDTYLESGRRLKEAIRPDQAEARVRINPPGGVARVLIISDLHFGSESADLKVIKALMEELKDPNTFAVLAGDLLEGIKQEYLSISTGSYLNFQEQIDSFRGMFLRKIVNEGKVLAVVSRYGSHDDWPSGKESLNGPAILMDSLTLADGSRVPLIFNGGTLLIQVGNSPEVTMRLFHQVSGSGSAINPVKSLRGVFVGSKIDRGQKTPLVAAAGHNHSRAGVSSEREAIAGGEVQVILLQGGTAKGLNRENPDFFMIGKGGGGVQPPGAAMILRCRPSEDEVQVVPTYGNERSQLLMRAMEVLNRSESLRVTEELRGELEREDGQIRLVMQKENSLAAERSGGREIRSKLYRQLGWQIPAGRLNLPMCVYFLAHTDFGSGEADLKHINKIVTEINKSERSVLLLLNGTLAATVPRMVERREVLVQFSETVGVVPTGRQLGVMLDSILRDDAWNKMVGKKGEDAEESQPIVTGDYLFYQSKLKGVPLFEGGATIVVDIGHNRFNILAVDGVGNFGSRQDPYLALIQMDKSSMVRNEVVTGGNSTIPGALTTPDTIFVANGWNAVVRDRRYGKASMMRAPKGGQGVILFPNGGGKGLIYGGGSLRELSESFTALTLYQGLVARNELKDFMRNRGRK